jgi:hypothetical protein
VIGNGDYRIASLTLNSGQKMAVVGKARLHVLGQTKTTAGSIIYIAPGASLELYAGGDVDLAGQGIWNYPGRAINLSIIGLNTCAGVSYTGGSKFCGTINAPYAAVKLAGNSESFGAFIGKTFQIVGTMDLITTITPGVPIRRPYQSLLPGQEIKPVKRFRLMEVRQAKGQEGGVLVVVVVDVRIVRRHARGLSRNGSGH